MTAAGTLSFGNFLGNWTYYEALTAGTTYGPYSCDVLVIASLSPSTSTACRMDFRTDSSNPPVSNTGEVYLANGGWTQTITSPVKKGNYWGCFYAQGSSCSMNASIIPLGALNF